MEMPIHLKTLPPEALDILRFYSRHNQNVAHETEIIENTGLNDRRFGVAKRRLVNKGLLLHDGYQMYRLSDAGQRAAKDLQEYEVAVPAGTQSARARLVIRRLVMVTPRVLLAHQPTNIFVGFDEPDDQDVLEAPLNLLVRLQVINGSPTISANKDCSLLLENRFARQVFEVAAGEFTKVRMRCFVYHVENEEDVPEMVGGMYVDLPVAATPEAADRVLNAYGVDVQFRVHD